jgi:hypothetical protein
MKEIFGDKIVFHTLAEITNKGIGKKEILKIFMIIFLL